MIYQNKIDSTGMMRMKPLKKKISISLDEPIIEKLKSLAEYNDRSLSSYINLILKEYLEKHDSPE